MYACMQDPFEALVDADMLEIFNLPSTRSIIAYRWLCVRKYFFLQLLLYLLFVGSVCVFTSFQAFIDTGDDVCVCCATQQ